MLRKQIRCQHLVSNETKIACIADPTNVRNHFFFVEVMFISDFPFYAQNLVVCNAGLSTGLQQESLLEEVSGFGVATEIIMIPGKSYCFIRCLNVANAQNIYTGLHGRAKLAQNHCVLYLSYATDGNAAFSPALCSQC